MEELWEDIKGYENRYQISNLGRVKSLKRTAPTKGGKERSVSEKILKQSIARNGYKHASLTHPDKKKALPTVHRLVALAFIENPHSKPFVNHKDGNKLNNRIDNLEWITPSENNIHAIKMGLQKGISGFENNRAKVDSEKIIKIYELYNSKKYTQKEIGEKLGVSNASVSRIVNKKRFTKESSGLEITDHKRVSITTTGENNGTAKLTEEKVKEIRSLYKNGMYTQSELGIMFGVHINYISSIIRFKTWKNI